MTRTLCILTAAMTALLVSGQGSALHCNGQIITIDTGVETFYLDDRSGEAGEIDHWTYLEENGIQGLQSGGQNCHFDCPIVFVDPCNHKEYDILII